MSKPRGTRYGSNRALARKDMASSSLFTGAEQEQPTLQLAGWQSLRRGDQLDALCAGRAESRDGGEQFAQHGGAVGLEFDIDPAARFRHALEDGFRLQ